MNDSIFEVSRSDYVNFVKTIKKDAREIREIQLDKWNKAIKIYSKKTGKCLTSRVINLFTDEENHIPEKYYIFELPDNDERLPPIPNTNITLSTKEEVQKFFDYIAKQQKENKND